MKPKVKFIERAPKPNLWGVRFVVWWRRQDVHHLPVATKEDEVELCTVLAELIVRLTASSCERKQAKEWRRLDFLKQTYRQFHIKYYPHIPFPFCFPSLSDKILSPYLFAFLFPVVIEQLFFVRDNFLKYSKRQLVRGFYFSRASHIRYYSHIPFPSTIYLWGWP